MYKLYFISIISIFWFSDMVGQAQVKRQTLSSIGASSTLVTSNNELIVQQSISQQSVSGPSQNSTSLVLQGFIQPEVILSPISQETSLISGNVFPNPFNSRVTISLQEKIDTPMLIKVFDVSGRTVFETETRLTTQLETEIDLFHLVAGSYILTLTNNYRSFSTTIIKS